MKKCFVTNNKDLIKYLESNNIYSTSQLDNAEDWMVRFYEIDDKFDEVYNKYKNEERSNE